MDVGLSRRRVSWPAAALVLATLAAAVCAAGGDAAAAAEALGRAEALITERAFDRAAAVLRDLLTADPANRRARELLAYALESAGDLEGELQVRSVLVREFPGDARTQFDYGRVLERSGEESEALSVYRRARALSAGVPIPELDAAIDRLHGRNATELGTPLSVLSDPDATAKRLQTGAAVPLGSGFHVALLAGHQVADSARGTGETDADTLAASLVFRNPSGQMWMVGPRVHVVSPEGAAQDRGIGGVVAGRSPLGPWLEAEASAEFHAPWDEAAVAILRGGRTTGALGRLYAHLLARRLLLQAGAQHRRLSILGAGPTRTEATQRLWVAGADLVLWRNPDAAVRGEMLDEALVAPTALPSAITLGLRHYEVFSRPDPDFAALIALAPRGTVDEASASVAVASPRGRWGLELRGGVGRDAARDAQAWRAGGAVTWNPKSAVRIALGYEEATEFATGLVGRRETGWLTLHVDL